MQVDESLDNELSNEKLDNESEGSENNDSEEKVSNSEYNELPKYAKDRLKRQKSRHMKELAERDNLIQQLMAKQGNADMNTYEASVSNKSSMNMNNTQVPSEDLISLIQKTVDLKQQQDQHQKNMEYLAQHYDNLEKKLDAANEKYDDFDEVVRDQSVPFTKEMGQIALILPNAEDVLYKLGKNRDELSRISKLPEIDQAKELIKLGFALNKMGSNSKTNSMDENRDVMSDLRGDATSSMKSPGSETVSDYRKMLLRR